MKLFVKTISLLLLFMLQVCFAETSEATYLVIGTDQQWQGAVTLRQPIMVASGAVLTIAPGTRIIADNPQSLIRVEGAIQVLGRAGQPVVFETPHGWQGIELFQAQGLSRFEYMQISSAALGLSSSLSRFEVKQSRFSNCQTAIKLHRQSISEITTTAFATNQLALDVGLRSQVTLRENRFSNNEKAVVASHNSSGELVANHFIGNQQGVYLQHLFPGQLKANVFEKNIKAIVCDQTLASPMIQENRFVENDQGIISLLASKPQLRGNTFHNNQLAVVNNQLGSPQVENNLFARNRIAIKSERRSAPVVERNQFVDNNLALFCDYLSYPRVKQNNFTGNQLAVKLGDHQSSDMEKQGASAEQVRKFLAESGKAGKMAVFDPASGVVDVSNNWWGRELNNPEPQLFFDRQQSRWVLDENTGERYLRDQISYTPWLTGPVADAGLN